MDQVTFGSIDATDFVPYSAEEGGWNTLAGDPAAQIHPLIANDKIFSALATFEPCKISFPSHNYGVTQILEGSTWLTLEGETREVKAGEMVFFKPGPDLVWENKVPLKEYFVVLL